jgi:hypothetical protein
MSQKERERIIMRTKARSQVSWSVPVVPATQEVEAGGQLEPKSTRPA